MRKRGFRSFYTVFSFPKSCSKAQVGLEYLMVIGIILVIMIPIFYYAVSESTGQIRLNQADSAVNSLAKTADSVYALGPGSRDYVSVTIPTGISGYYVNQSEIVLTMDISGTRSDAVAFSQALLTGAIPIEAGTYWIPVEMLESGIVRIGTGNDTVAPLIVYTYPSGRINFNDITLKANTNEPAQCKFDPEDNIVYASMGNNFVGNLMSHEKYLGIMDEGNHVYYARCVDPSLNFMQSSAIINFTINTTVFTGNGTGNATNETYETDPPVITPVNPADSYTDKDGIVLFQYNVSDASTIAFCRLIMNKTSIEFATGISRNTTNNITKGGLEYGNYNWSINCTDVHGNEGSSESRRIFINYTQDHDIPLVYLMAPANNTIRGYWLVKFSYNTSDATSAISYCTLHMNGMLDEGGTLSWNVIDSSIVENNAESITLPLFRANYTWQVSCTDRSYNANTGYSGKMNLRVNVTAGEESFVNSCAGWCGWQDMSSGKCDNSDQKCDNNCGLPYSSNHNCYAGDSVSLQYCLAGAESKACCCIL